MKIAAYIIYVKEPTLIALLFPIRTVVDPSIILRIAQKVSAICIILANNHLSGNLKKSRADELITIKIKQGAQFMNIQVADHLILSFLDSNYSFANEGII